MQRAPVQDASRVGAFGQNFRDSSSRESRRGGIALGDPRQFFGRVIAAPRDDFFQTQVVIGVHLVHRAGLAPFAEKDLQRKNQLIRAILKNKHVSSQLSAK